MTTQMMMMKVMMNSLRRPPIQTTQIQATEDVIHGDHYPHGFAKHLRSWQLNARSKTNVDGHRFTQSARSGPILHLHTSSSNVTRYHPPCYTAQDVLYGIHWLF